MPARIGRDAEAHGVEVRPACANVSRWECTLEPTDDEGHFAVRLGPRMVRGLATAHAAAIVAARGDEPLAVVVTRWSSCYVRSTMNARASDSDVSRGQRRVVVRRDAIDIGEPCSSPDHRAGREGI